MNDHHLDPPEYPEVPECCDLEMSVDDQGNCKCESCGKVIEAAPDIEPPDFEEWKCEKCGDKYPCECIMNEMSEDSECPHGNRHGECDACDHLGDLAFDASREQRLFGNR